MLSSTLPMSRAARLARPAPNQMTSMIAEADDRADDHRDMRRLVGRDA